MEQEDAEHTIPIDSSETERLAFSHFDETEYQEQEKHQHSRTAEESFLLAHRAENEVGILLRHEFQLGLRSVKEALSP